MTAEAPLRADWARARALFDRLAEQPADARAADLQAEDVEPALLAGDSTPSCLPQVWARRRIMQLADEATYRSPEPRQREIERLALDYGLASPFTAFVAVDALSSTSGSFGTTVEQPVPMPAGVRYDTTLDR